MIFIKLVRESIRMSLHEFRENKLRTFLSLLGITIGIFLIISVLSVVDNLEKKLRDSFDQLGNDVIYVQKWPWGGMGGEYEWWKYWNRPEPSYKEFKIIQKKIDQAEVVAIFMSLEGKTIEYRENSVDDISLRAGSYEIDKIFIDEISMGRYFTMLESSNGTNSAILGYNIAKKLFSENQDPLYKNVKILGKKFVVIGVFAKKGEDMLNNSSDNMVQIPYAEASKLIDMRSRRVHPSIAVKCKTGVSAEELKDELRGLMRSVRRLKPKQDDNFALNQLSMISEGINGIFKVMNLVGWFIGIFSILVGGFGIANIMFVSVRERTNLIGIKKAIGAKNYFILQEFLIESVILCLIGGVFGLLLVFILTTLITYLTEITFYLSLGNIILGLTISASIGLIAGFVPAYMAARMDPVEAINFH